MVSMFDDFDTQIQSDEFATEYEDYLHSLDEQYFKDMEEEYGRAQQEEMEEMFNGQTDIQEDGRRASAVSTI